MKIDHIIFFSSHSGNEADELVNSGLAEGSNRIHPGQGTRNRKFYFDNFFLEILWVDNEAEVQSNITLPTRIWERVNPHWTGMSPFGLCLANTNKSMRFFRDAIDYKPVYLPEGYSFKIIPNQEAPELPWTCLHPFPDYKPVDQEPKDHKPGIRYLTKAIFGIPSLDKYMDFVSFFEEEDSMVFIDSDIPRLILQFDEGKKNKVIRFKNLPLIIEY